MTLISSLNRATSSLKSFQTGAQSADRAAAGLQSGATGGERGIKRLKDSAQGAGKELNSLRSSADRAEKSLARAGKAGQTGGTQIGNFKAGADKAEKGMSGVNRSMKGNILGTLLGLFTPLIEKVVAMATQSKTMQRVLRTAFDAIQKVIGTVMKAVGPIMQQAGALISRVWNNIRTVIGVVVGAVAVVIMSNFEAWKNTISNVMNTIKRTVTTVWNSVKAVISPVVTWIRDVVPRSFSTVKSKLSDTWNGLKDIATRAFGSMRDAVRGPLNSVIGLINSAIGGLNRIRVSIPGWVPMVGGRTFGISLPTIPRLAQGGIVQPRSGGVHTIVAEAGEAEAVLPLSQLNRLLGGARGGLRPASAGGGTAMGAGVTEGFYIEQYYEAPSSDLRQTAAALLFLSKARG